MKKAELQAEIEELKKRIEELEKRQPIIINYPQPLNIPIWDPYNPYTPRQKPWEGPSIICQTDSGIKI